MGPRPPEDHLALPDPHPGRKNFKVHHHPISAMPTACLRRCVAINYDISALLTVETALKSLPPAPGRSGREPERITRSVSDLLDDLLEESVALGG